jgi:phytoene desaturase
MQQKKAIVIGAGFAGMSAASFLAKDGFEVTILEKNESSGGRGRKFKHDSFLFDMGPSWYWMPDVFENYFHSFKKKSSDYYQLSRLSPSYRVFFHKNNIVDVPASALELGNYFETLEKGAGQKLQAFLKEAAHKYEVGINDLVFKPGRSLLEFAHPAFLAGVFKLDVFTSHAAHIRKFFQHPDIIRLLEFPVLFLGAKPENTPALYSLMNYADISLGTWYPMGGMTKIAEAMEELAKSLGVKFVFNAPVTSFEFSGKKISSVLVSGAKWSADVIVAGADYHHVDQKILPEEKKSYSKKYWDQRVLAPSSLIFYLGFNRKIKNLLHHNLFFDEDFKPHAAQIYDHPQWPEKPLFYVCAPSKTDPSVALPEHENVFVLIPVAPDLEDTEAIRDHYYNMILKRMEHLLDEKNLANAVIYKRSYAHKDFISDYNSFKGNAYGLANTLKQTAILKPSIKSKKITNLYFTGQLTVPGPGVPPSLISGEVVAREISKEISL